MISFRPLLAAAAAALALVAQAETAPPPKVIPQELVDRQPAIIDAQVQSISEHSPPGSQAYFLGFAGVGEERVFAEEIDLAARRFAERIGLERRSLRLVTDQRDLEKYPLASAALLLLGFAGGLFTVPLHALLQQKPAVGEKGSVFAVSNLLSTVAILGASGSMWYLDRVVGIAPDRVILAFGVVQLAASGYVLWLLPDFCLRFSLLLLRDALEATRKRPPSPDSNNCAGLAVGVFSSILSDARAVTAAPGKSEVPLKTRP